MITGYNHIYAWYTNNFQNDLLQVSNSWPVLWISGRPVAKCDPSLDRAIQHEPISRPMADPALDEWEHDQTENMQILC